MGRDAPAGVAREHLAVSGTGVRAAQGGAQGGRVLVPKEQWLPLPGGGVLGSLLG